jgi:molybdate transport system regulatory protein
MPDLSNIEVNFKFWLQAKGTNLSFGEGRWRLLKMLNETGSLKSASRDLGVSYRKAWGDLKKTESLFNAKLVLRERGGRDGGKMKLTEDGKKLVGAYEELRGRLKSLVQEFYDHEFEEIL